MYSINQLKDIIKQNNVKQTLVFPEGNEQKIQETANMLVKDDLANVVLLFDNASEIPSNLESKVQSIVVSEYDITEMVEKLVEVRKGKVDVDQAKKLVLQRNYFGVMMMQLELADGMVCGLTYTTADTLRPALQIIKTAPGYSLASSVFIMTKDDKNFLFTDCALNVDPTSEQLADIAVMAGEFANSMNEPNVQVAMLSYSTIGSGSGPMVDKVKKAVEILQSKETESIKFDGELQFDAATDLGVRAKKHPNSKITKEYPDVFVFPDLGSGNIGYKIAQRLAGYQAAGPFILGLNKPVNDLSRGATLEDIYQTSIVTIYSAMIRKENK